MTPTWVRISGRELAETVDRGESLRTLIDPCQAIYFWRRTFKPPRNIIHNQARFVRWLETCLKPPVGIIQGAQLSHYAMLDSLTLGGRGLTDIKRAHLLEMARNPRRRKFLAHFVASLEDFTPPVYCGETNSLARRVKEHVTGETLLKETIEETLGLTWSDLILFYWKLPFGETTDTQTDTNRRQLLELISTRLSFCGFVKRPG